MDCFLWLRRTGGGSMTNISRLARLKAELEEAEVAHAKFVRETWGTSSTALEAKRRVDALRDEIEREKRRIEDEAQGRLW